METQGVPSEDGARQRCSGGQPRRGRHHEPHGRRGGCIPASRGRGGCYVVGGAARCWSQCRKPRSTSGKVAVTAASNPRPQSSAAKDLGGSRITYLPDYISQALSLISGDVVLSGLCALFSVAKFFISIAALKMSMNAKAPSRTQFIHVD